MKTKNRCQTHTHTRVSGLYLNIIKHLRLPTHFARSGARSGHISSGTDNIFKSCETSLNFTHELVIASNWATGLEFCIKTGYIPVENIKRGFTMFG